MYQTNKNNNTNGENGKDFSGYQPVQFIPCNSYPPDEDEIDLADLFAVLYRKRRVIATVVFISLILAFGVSLFVTKRYKTETMIEVGMTVVEGEYRNIENNKAVENRIDAISKAIAGEMSQEASNRTFSFSRGLEIQVPEQGNMVTVSLTTPFESKNDALDFLFRVNSRLIKDHARILNQQEQRIKTFIAGKELELKNIDTEIMNLKRDIKELEREFEKNHASKEIEIKSIGLEIQSLLDTISEQKRDYEKLTEEKDKKLEKLGNSIKDIYAQQNFFSEQKALLENERHDLNKRINTTEAQYQELLESKLHANEGKNGTEAVTMMLFSNEMLRMHKYLDSLRHRHFFEIPQELARIDVELGKLESNLVSLESEKKFEENRLAALKPEFEEEIQGIQRKIEKLEAKKSIMERERDFLRPEYKDKVEAVEGQIEKLNTKKNETDLIINENNNKLENMIHTSTVVKPRFSDNPVSPNVKLIVALGFVGGLFLAVFLAFIAEFWSRNKQKITE